jgi:hypothetical protein
VIWKAINEALNALKLVGVIDRTVKDVIARRITGCCVCLNFGNKECQEFIVN